jgi:hypothetical protein
VSRTLRGLRYLPDRERKGWLIEAAEDLLPTASLEQAHAFYDYVADLDSTTLRDHAFLGCNDRFYLGSRLCGRSDLNDPWLYARCREVEADPDGHLDLWARYHYKSTIITFLGTIQEIMCDPEVKIAIFSATKDIAREFLGQIKEEFESNDLLKAIYSDVLWREPRKIGIEGRPPKWGVARGIVVKRKSNPKEATVEAHGLLDGQPTSRHFDVHNYDDIVTQDYLSDDQIKKTTERWEMADNLGGHHGVRKRIAGTRYHFADTYGVIIDERRGGLRPRIYAATDDGTLNGKPVFLTDKRWNEVKSTQRSTVSAQMLLDPVAGQEQMFRIEWSRPYMVRPNTLNVYIMCDPSKGKNKNSDRTAFAVVGIDANNNKYLLDGYCHRMPLSERWTRLRDLWKKWSNVPGVQMVKVGYEVYGMQSDLEHFTEKMRAEDLFFTIHELNWVREGSQSKVDRIERLEPEMREGRFFFPGLVWYPDFAVETDGEPKTIRDVNGTGIAMWSVEKNKRGAWVAKYRPYMGPTKAMKEADELGQPHRKAEALRRIEQLGEGEHRQRTIYDLVRYSFEELRKFPFAVHDDFLDALSRYNDMEPLPPSLDEEADLAPSVHPDT